MNKISRIQASRITGINNNPVNVNTATVQSYHFKETFNFSELEIEANYSSDIANEELLFKVLFRLFRDILIDGADIVPRGALADKKLVIEASFQPPSGTKKIPQLFLPVPGVKTQLNALKFNLQSLYLLMEKELDQYCQQIFNSSNYKDIVRLIILASHEYGHFLSYQRGLHDADLKTGLYFMHTKQVGINFEKYTYQVFSEEATAWRFAKQRLEKYGFQEWSVFNSVKKSSLQEYYKLFEFNKKNVSIDILSKISMLDIDLRA